MKKIILTITLFLLLLMNVKALDKPYLKEIKIDDVVINDFSFDKTTYNIEVDENKETIKISYTFPDGKNGRDDYKIAISGATKDEAKLKYGKNTIKIIVTDMLDANNQTTYVLNITRPDKRSSNNLLKTLTIDNEKVTLLDDETDYVIHVDNNKNQVEAMATLQDMTAKFVTGYGERFGNNAVPLRGEKTTFEIKVQAENTKIRTYKITIVKSNYKSDDATLKSLKIKDVKLDFKSNIYEYNVEVQNKITKIEIEAVANHNKAKVEIPKDLNLKEGINNFVVVVTAEDGKTTQEYKINVTRKPETVLVSKITIDDIFFDFDPNTYEYKILTAKKNLKFHVSLNKKTATAEILNNESLENGSVVKVLIHDGEREIFYNFKIVNQEIIEVVEDKNMLATNIASKSKFFEQYEMLFGLISIGIGTFALLMALLSKPRKEEVASKIM